MTLTVNKSSLIKAVFLCIAIVVIRAAVLGSSFKKTLETAGNDDIMRLLSVRQWLAGQNWFDMTHYQFLAPEGLSLHWSRYIDLGIGSIFRFAEYFVDPSKAEHFAIVAWPLLLLVLLILTLGLGAQKLIGNSGAIVAMFSAILLPAIGPGYFYVGKLDHHNIQILLMTVAAIAAARPNEHIGAGIVAGTAAAFSLAIGLETLFFIAAIGVLIVLQMAFQQPYSRKKLIGFSISLFFAAVVFHFGQTPVDLWFTTQCDKLSPPHLAIAGVGAVAGLAPAYLIKSGSRPTTYILLTGVTAVVGMLIIWRLVSPCLQNPYADLPVALQTMISDTIVEASPLIPHARANFANFFNVFAPAFFAVGLATCVFFFSTQETMKRQGILPIIILGWIGAIACIFQIRQIVLLAAVVPILTGYVIISVVDRWMEQRTKFRTVLMLLAPLLTLLLPPVAHYLGQGFKSITAPELSEDTQFTMQDGVCTSVDVLEKLNEITPSRVLTPLNLGPMLALSTDHTAMSAPYHRSPQAMANGYLAYNGDDANLWSTLRDQEIDYVVVCRGSIYGSPDSVGSRLAGLQEIPGLVQTAISDPNLYVFKVVTQ